MEDEQKILMEYEQYRAQIDVYKHNLELITANILELAMVKESMSQINSIEKDNEVLVPLGGGSFAKAKIIDKENVVVGLGADVAVKKTIPEATTDVESRVKELEKMRAEQTEKLQLTLSKIEELTPKVQEIVEKAQKEG